MIKMRTRFLNRMTNKEVEEYLKRNDIIFVPTGPTEMHGRLPLDVEYIGPLGMAFAMAEEVDGLVMEGLKYFYNGSCATGRGTVKISVHDGYDYLKAILYSLTAQGFRRIVLMSGHGTSELTLAAVQADFFDETKIPIAWVEQMTTTNFAKKLLGPEECAKYNDFRDLGKGCYEILGQKDELVVDPAAAEAEKKEAGGFMPGKSKKFMGLPESLEHLEHIIHFGSFAYGLSFYMGDITDHGGVEGAFRSVEERDAVCKAGLEQLRKVVKTVDMPRYMECYRKQIEYTNTHIRENYGDCLPWSKAFLWK